MGNGAFKFKDNSGNVVSYISGSGTDIIISGGTLDLSGMCSLNLGGISALGTIQTASFAPNYLLTSSFNTYTGSINTIIGTLQTNTGSLNNYTSSNNNRLNVIESTTGSLNSYTSSNDTIIGSLQTGTSSLNNYTSSNNTRLSCIEIKTGSYATTGSNTFCGNLTVTGYIDAQELRTTYISSSILYRSGSTKFGDELSDNHSFTGSMLISGSISVPGSNLVSGSAQIDVLSTTNIARLATTGSNIFTGEITGTNAKFSGGICASSFNPTGSTISCNGMYLPATNTLGFSTCGVNRMTLSCNGNVGIGTVSPSNKLNIVGQHAQSISLESYSSTYSDYQGEPTFTINKSASNTIGTKTSTRDNENLGSVVFQGVVNSAFRTAAYLRVTQTGVVGAENIPAKFGFYTSDGANSAAERLTILANGNVGIGTASPDAKLDIVGTGGSPSTALKINDSSNNLITFATTAGEDKWSYYLSGGDLRLYDYTATAGDRVTFKAGGNVGIGTTTPLQKFVVSAGQGVFTGANLDGNPGDASGPALRIGYMSTSDYGYISAINSGIAVKNLVLQQAGGNVGIGTASPSSKLEIFNSSSIIGETSTLGLLINNNGSIGKLAQIGFGYSESRVGAVIGGVITNGGGSTASDLFFATRASTDGAVSPTERMRITCGGTVLINTITDLTTVKLRVNGNIVASGVVGTNILLSRDDSGSTMYGFFNNGSGLYTLTNFAVANVATINMTSGVYTPTSDITKKKDFELSNIGLNEILGLKPTLYRIKSEDESSEKHLGFIAQEVKEFIPQAYVENGINENKFIGLDYQAITSALVKAVQEQQCRINLLETCLGLI